MQLVADVNEMGLLELYEVVKLVVTNSIGTCADVGRLTKVLRENKDLKGKLASVIYVREQDNLPLA